MRPPPFSISGGVKIDVSTLSAQIFTALAEGIEALSGYIVPGYTDAENAEWVGLLVMMKTIGAAIAAPSKSAVNWSAVTNITMTNPTSDALGTFATCGTRLEYVSDKYQNIFLNT